MVFSSFLFLFFLILLLVLLYFPFSNFGKKIILCIFSCFFYAAWDYRYLGLLFWIGTIDYLAGCGIFYSQSEYRKKIILWMSIVSNLGILGYFKYYNFFIDNLNGLLSGLDFHFPHEDILLPIGISFYTFKSLSYTLDIYRKHIQPCSSYLDYMMFLTFFPELIAGPIVRASIFLPQMTKKIGPSKSQLSSGLSIFLLGLFKKKFISDRLATIVDPIFSNPEIYSTPSVWMGVFAYTLQIYCDFSGYSDMAIGIAKMIGYDFPKNFNLPYLSANITDFWRRWHITLSQWLKDYLYISLGGNRNGKIRTYFNILVTMLLGGLWHGASWNFILFGGLHGIALVFHKQWRENFSHFKIPMLIGMAMTFTFVLTTLIIFRAQNLSIAFFMLKKMYFPSEGTHYYSIIFLLLALLVGIGHVIGHFKEHPKVLKCLFYFGLSLEKTELSGNYFIASFKSIPASFFVTLFLLILFFFSVLETSPFIYFQF